MIRKKNYINFYYSFINYLTSGDPYTLIQSKLTRMFNQPMYCIRFHLLVSSQLYGSLRFENIPSHGPDSENTLLLFVMEYDSSSNPRL